MLYSFAVALNPWVWLPLLMKGLHLLKVLTNTGPLLPPCLVLKMTASWPNSMCKVCPERIHSPWWFPDFNILKRMQTGITERVAFGACFLDLQPAYSNCRDCQSEPSGREWMMEHWRYSCFHSSFLYPIPNMGPWSPNKTKNTKH